MCELIECQCECVGGGVEGEEKGSWERCIYLLSGRVRDIALRLSCPVCSISRHTVPCSSVGAYHGGF